VQQRRCQLQRQQQRQRRRRVWGSCAACAAGSPGARCPRRGAGEESARAEWPALSGCALFDGVVRSRLAAGCLWGVLHVVVGCIVGARARAPPCGRPPAAVGAPLLAGVCMRAHAGVVLVSANMLVIRRALCGCSTSRPVSSPLGLPRTVRFSLGAKGAGGRVRVWCIRRQAQVSVTNANNICVLPRLPPSWLFAACCSMSAPGSCSHADGWRRWRPGLPAAAAYTRLLVPTTHLCPHALSLIYLDCQRCKAPPPKTRELGLCRPSRSWSRQAT
jgi:hypothetical protein